MRATILLLLALTLATPLASAQVMGGALTFRFTPPDHALKAGDHVTLQGMAELTVDATAYEGLVGIPVSYSITKAPTQVGAIVSPANDVFPLPATPPAGPAFTTTRPVTLTLVVSDALPAGSTAGIVQVSGVTAPTTAGRSIASHGDVPLMLQGAPRCAPGSVSSQAFDAAPVAGNGWAYALGALAAVGLAAALARPRAAGALGVLALVAAGGMVPVASAQLQGGSINLVLTPPSHTLAPGSVTTIPVTAQVTLDSTAYEGLIGVPITFVVTKAPAWASVALSPSTTLVPLPATPPPGPSFTMNVPFDAAILVGDVNFTGTRVDTLEITAATSPTFLGKQVSGKVVFPVAVASPGCAPASATVAAPAVSVTPTTTGGDSPLTVQTHEARAPVGGYAVVLGCAIAGAGVGLVLRRRRQSK